MDHRNGPKRWTAKMTFHRPDAVVLLPVIPSVSTVGTLAFFLLDWPDAGGLQFLAGLVAGAVFWLVATLLAGGDITAATSASAEAYEELRARVKALGARVAAIRALDGGTGRDAEESLAEAEALIELLEGDLGSERKGSPYRWIHGHGYINAWRDLHRAEDLVVIAEPREVVYAAGLTNLERLAASGLTTATVVTPLAKEVSAALTAKTTKTEGITEHLAKLLALPHGDSREHVLAEIDKQWARALIREAGFRIHFAQSAAWDQLVNLRNRTFSALVLAMVMTYSVIALLVLVPVERDAMIAGVAFYLVGAVVGTFNELYKTSTGGKGTIFDYGLGQVRLVATPVLSGIAAVGGVLVSNLAGPLLLVEPTASESGTQTVNLASAALSDIFSIASNPAGLLVAAVFGLTPGLLLTRLRDRGDDYKAEIARLTGTPSGPSGDKSGG